MAKSKGKAKSKERTKSKAQPSQPTRRDFMGLAKKGAIGLGLVSFTGFFAVKSVRAALHERDLSRLGDGKPTVVQVHDPNCSICTALQKETRQALSGFAECDFQYLIADIKTDEGSAFASTHAVPHVTLLLFDAEGQLQEILRGMRQSEELETLFVAHHAAFGAKT